MQSAEQVVLVHTGAALGLAKDPVLPQVPYDAGNRQPSDMGMLRGHHVRDQAAVVRSA